ncbi:VWA domain-containing protein [Formosa sp. S-31]|uniref:VWA domain-containing protein n=1 Tax=Formosa sp. S-31 TaxID=2790949 RepID=UPI003EC08EFD
MPVTTIIYIILAGIVALLVALFQYKYKEKSMSKRYMLFSFLRFLTVFCILLLLINPKFEQLKTTTQKPVLNVALDNSESVTELNQNINVQQVLNAIKQNRALNDKFNITYFTFGSEIKDTDSLSFSEKQTDISSLFKTFKSLYNDQLAPILLISDGNQTYGEDYVYSDINQPVFPVILGDTISHIDLRISQLNVNKYAYLKNKFPVEAILVYQGTEAVESVFTVTTGKQTVFKKSISFSKTNNSEVIQFTLPAAQVGVSTYQATITPLSTEKNVLNNTKNFAVEVIDEQMKIAIISNFIHPDIGMLKKSIESNEQRTVTVFDTRTFKSKMDEFQLVILYQPDNQFKYIFDDLKTNKRNAFIITGPKTDWYFLNRESSFFKHDISGQSELYQGSYNSNFSSFIVDDLNFESFPPLTTVFGDIEFSVPFEPILFKKLGQITTDKPLLATVEDQGRRVALLLGENIWQWRAQSFLNHNSFYPFDNFIGKQVQYLASTQRKSRLVLDYDAFYEGINQVVVKAQVFNKNYEFDTTERVQISLKDKNTNINTTLPFVLKNNNYQVDLSHLPASEYDFTVKALASNLSKSGSLTILDYNIEQQFLNADVTKLQQLASNTLGKSYFVTDSSELLEDLIEDSRFKPIQKSTKTTQAMIDWKFLLGIIVSCLALEWFIRKYNGLI